MLAGRLDGKPRAWAYPPMRAPQRHSTSTWRSGCLILGLYAMLLQAFFTGAGGMALPAVGSDMAALCVSAGGDGASAHVQELAQNLAQGLAQDPVQAPAPAHGCVCPVLCHGGAFLAPSFLALTRAPAVWRAQVPGASQAIAYVIAPHARPPARGPPHDRVVHVT